MESNNLSIHHIGGRKGTMEFPLMPIIELERDIYRVLYDADKNCIEEIETIYGQLNNTKILPYCISDKKGTQKFYILADRYESSLFKPKKFNKDNFIANEQFQFDSDLRDKVDDIIKLNVLPLDYVCSDKRKNDVLPPDYLSLDVEGAELKILKGAKRSLKSKTLSIKCEFNNFPDCSKLIKYCEKLGFYVSNTSLFENSFQSRKQVNIGLKGAYKGYSMVGDITFLKKGSLILKTHKDPLNDLIKIAFIAFNDNQLDKMYEYLDLIKEFKNSNEFLNLCSKEIRYISFIKDFIEAKENYPNITQVKFSTLFPKKIDRSHRFDINYNDYIQKNRKKFRKKYFKEHDSKEFKKSCNLLLSKNYIGIETVCKDYGFTEFADAFKDERILSMGKLLKWLGFLSPTDKGSFVINIKEIEKLCK